MEQKNDVWQVMVDGEVYETDFNGLVQWHTEGCFHPNDMVRKGNRGWIEAWKVPQLRPIFSGQPIVIQGQQTVPAYSQSMQPAFSGQEPSQQFGQQGVPQGNGAYSNGVTQNIYGEPTQATVYDNTNSYGQQQQQQSNSNYNQHQSQGWTPPPSPAHGFVSEVCVNHPHAMPKYICRACSSLLCNDCPKKMGMSVFICPVCGAMCELYEQIQKKQEIAFRKSQGYGLEDLGQSLAYPLKFPASLIGGALLYAVFLFGGLIGFLLARMLLFGCIVVIIQQIAWGRLEKNFISQIGENGVLEDLIKPGFLSFGVVLVSWGPMLLGAAIAIYLALTGFSNMRQPQNLPQNQPKQSFEIQAEPRERSFQYNNVQSDRNTPELQPINSDEGMPEQTEQRGVNNGALGYLVAAALPLILLIGIGAIWGFFYYPMALTIAGYTQDFLSTINPLVGLDTMKRMGGTYFKAFGMYVIVMIISGALNFIVDIITMPFSTPFGNIPQNLLGGVITFYSSMVIACLLGLALFKCSDRLGIETD